MENVVILVKFTENTWNFLRDTAANLLKQKARLP